MSREEKEKMLSEKMENIRKRNEELRKRHEEIEADKKNADRFSSTVTMDKVKPYVMKAPRMRPEKAERPREANEQPAIPRPSDIMPARQRLSENDGPPPDPSYRFLSDPDRDGNDKERKRDGRGKRKGKQGFKWGPEDGPEDEETKLDPEGDENLELSPREAASEHGLENSTNFRGRGRSEMSNGEQKFASGRGRGRGRGHDKLMHEHEYGQHEDGLSGGDGDGGGRGRGKSNLSFACRDIRYYPDENEDHRTGRDGRGRGRGRPNFNQWNYSEEGHGRPHRHGGFEPQRGRGRGRSRDQQREYERWKAERTAIDEARVTRGKTHGGSWRREWDNDKINQGESEESEPVYDPRYPRSKSENFKLADLINLPNDDGSPPESSHKHERIQRERRIATGQESREKFVKVDTERVQKQLRLGTDDLKDMEKESVQNTEIHCNEISPTEDEGPHTYTDMKDATEENPAEEESSTCEVVKDDHESMDSDKEPTDVEIPFDECCDKEPTDVEIPFDECCDKEPTDVEIPFDECCDKEPTEVEIPFDECCETENQKFAEETGALCQSVALDSVAIMDDNLVPVSVSSTEEGHGDGSHTVGDEFGTND